MLFMFKILSIFLFVIISSIAFLHAENIYKTNIISSDTTNNLQKNSIISSVINDTTCCISINEFTNAGARRWLIDGTQPFKTTKIKPISAIAFGSALTGIFVVQHIMQQNTIWKKVGDFHFAEDWQWSYALDKGGHFYGGYATSYVFSEALMGIGFSWEAATITGASLGLAYMGYIEVLDGKSQDFGFSPTDFYADVAGSAYYVLQHYVPFLQNISPKFMYVNPQWLGEKSRNEAESFIDDYSSQTFWLSFNIHNMLPEKIRGYWPKWLELSVGYGVFSLCTPPGKNGLCDPAVSLPFSSAAWGNRSLMLSLDFNLVHLLPDGGSFWNWSKQSLNLFKLIPSPTLQFSDRGTKFYLLFPFKISF